MLECSNQCPSSSAESVPSGDLPRVVPIDAAMREHLSRGYWDWRELFDRDPQANPMQHADYVLAELPDAKSTTRAEAVLLRHGPESDCQALGILVPKDVRTSQVGGLGPAWTMRGLRLVGGRFLAREESFETQSCLLSAAMRHCAAVGADFLLIEDLDESSPLHPAVQREAADGCRLFAARDLQPRWRIEFPAVADDYWKTFSSRTLQRRRSKLKRYGQTSLVRVTDIGQIPEFLRAAHEISKQSWQSRQLGLRIRNDESELRQMSILAQHGHLRSYLWAVEGKPAAFAVCHQHRGCFRYEEIAYCAEFRSLSPGVTLLHQIVEDLFRHDPPQWFDFGGGDAEYKQQFGNRESRSQTLWIVPPTWRAGAALAYLNGCRRLRSVARGVVKTCGLATKARQWLRYGGGPVECKRPASGDAAPGHDTDCPKKSGAELP